MPVFPMKVPARPASGFRPSAGTPSGRGPPQRHTGGCTSMAVLTDTDIPAAEDISPDDPPAPEATFRFLDSDIGDFLKVPKTATAREYEKKAQGILALFLRGTISNPETVADAAAILAFGDDLSKATGELADHSEFARTLIDTFASPDSPYAGFVIAGLPLLAQIMRNHEKRVTKPVRVKQLTVRVPFRKKPVVLNIRLKPSLPRHIRNQTVPPAVCAELVFSNTDLMKTLKRRGIDVAWRPDGNR